MSSRAVHHTGPASPESVAAMKLRLDRLLVEHPKLNGHPTDLATCASLALQRGGHISPARAPVNHDGNLSTLEIEWTQRDTGITTVLDTHRLTEDGAEAIVITYAHGKAGWTVKRRMQRGESADWLMHRGAQWLALEVSGTMAGDCVGRLKEKRLQLARCSLPADRLAVVVSFEQPAIFAGTP